jgi:uncharacterized SAM-binding protein YcdF (DUF218 family)
METQAPGGVTRVVAVLGYSARRHDSLHPVCAARVAEAQAVATAGDVVVLSGWARRGSAAAEAELMADEWTGPAASLLHDAGARHTVGNAASVVAVARELGAEELVVVTSWWHRPRAAALVRRAARQAGIRTRTVAAASPRSAGLLLREAVCLAGLPLQLLALPRAVRSRDDSTLAAPATPARR